MDNKVQKDQKKKKNPTATSEDRGAKAGCQEQKFIFGMNTKIAASC